MVLRLLLCASLAALALSGCNTPDKKKDGAAEKKKKPAAAMKDVNGDVNFQAFLGRLRQAVAKKDRDQLASMMMPDFGYRFDTPPAGETPFDYWDQNNLWPELELLLSKRFQPKGDYMVAPPAFVDDDKFRGYRAGIRSIGGSWRLAYFVTGEDLLQ